MEGPASPEISTSLVDVFGGLDLALNDDFFSLENSNGDDVFGSTIANVPVLPDLIKQEYPSMDQVKVEHKERKTMKREILKEKKGTQQPKKSRGINKEPKKAPDAKYHKRLQANKKSAQASRERRKSLKSELEILVGNLQQENKSLQKTITELGTENQVLKKEFVTLQHIIMENPLLSKLFSKASNFILPPMEDTTNSTITSIAAIQMIILLYSFRQQLMPNLLRSHLEPPIPALVV